MTYDEREKVATSFAGCAAFLLGATIGFVAGVLISCLL